MRISRWNEYWAAALALIWGLIFILPGDILAGIARYHAIEAYFPDWAWGTVYIICGLALFFNFPPLIYRHLHWVLCTLWMGMAVLALLSGISLGTILISSLCWFVAMTHAGRFWWAGINMRTLSV